MKEFRAALATAGAAIGLSAPEVRDASGQLATTMALDAVRGHRRGGLLLLGEPGTGKTLAAIRWLMAPLLEPKNWNFDGTTWWCRFHASRIFRTARSLSRVNQYEGPEVEMLVSARALVLDDLGLEFQDRSGFLASLVDYIVTERHRRSLATVITANLTMATFTERYGERSVSRIGGSGGVVVCAGDDLRLGAPKKRGVSGVDEAAVAARAKECAAEFFEDQRRWAEHRAGAEASLTAARAASPALRGAPMTEAEVSARKLELAAQARAWRERNPEPAA